MNYGTKSNIAFWSSMIAVLAIVILFVVVFSSHNKNSRLEFIEILKETENFYTNSNNAGNDNRINARLNLLGERIVHYQKTASDSLNWWIAVLSILIVLTNAISLYNYNEGKKELDNAVKKARKLNAKLLRLIKIARKEFEKTDEQLSIKANKIDGGLKK